MRAGHLQRDLPTFGNDSTAEWGALSAKDADTSTTTASVSLNHGSRTELMSAAMVEERAAAQAFKQAKAAHQRARAEYVAKFSLARRAFKDLGSRTKAYRKEHVAPKEKELLAAMARWAIAAWSLSKSNLTTCHGCMAKLKKRALRVGQMQVDLGGRSFKFDPTSFTVGPTTEDIGASTGIAMTNNADNHSETVSAAMIEERVAAQAFAHAKVAHDIARARYIAQFSLIQRAFKHFGTRTKAYRAEHVTPKEKQLMEAIERWAIAVWST